MTTNIFRVALALAAFALGGRAASAQAGPPPPPSPPPLQIKPLDLGRLDGVNYVNEFFGLSLAVPQDWVVIGGPQRGAIMDETKKLLTADDARKQRMLDASVQRSTILLSLTKLPVGSTEGFNASFMLVAERVPTALVGDAATVIRSMEEGFKGTAFKVEFQGPIRTLRVGGADFATVTTRTTAPQGVFMQKFYVTLKKGYALQLVYTYLDESDVATFEAMVKSLAVK